ncbi:GNAT family N-acetyltransferase [Leucobacter aridicollis]|uniref:GNAT family N-acetyltransferase n=1 Tax=Leucobacter aridicollis TaxID=283878 RepID=UPI0021688C07|nr:GNAT family N-acetyltransferase [Leucobacter aridicollis]MCS3428514.1 mycothiol synthase [Leucobacter aridicollis]
MTGSLPAGIADFRGGTEATDPWVAGEPLPEALAVVPANPDWPERARILSDAILAAVGDAAVSLEHVGSTAVPGLPAKDVIDLDLIVLDPDDEAGYVPALTALGYRHTVREPALDGHRMLRLEDPRVNLHVFAPGTAEPARHILFRDWLRANPDDAKQYVEAKTAAAEGAPQTAMAYNRRKHATVREIYARAFAAAGVPLADRALAPTTLPELPRTAGGEPLNWRPATDADAEAIWELFRVAGSVDHPHELYGLDLVKLWLTGDRFTFATDTVLAFSQAGALVAFGEAKLDDDWRDQVDVFIDGVVHPEWRGLGIGSAMLAWQEARGRQLLGGVKAGLPGMLSFGAREANTDILALAADAGYLPVRWWMELGRPLADEIAVRDLPAGVELRTFAPELSESTRLAVNDAFRDHWGSRPMTEREWADELELDEFSPELSRVLVTDSGESDGQVRVVAAVLTEVNEEEWALNGGPFGYMSTIGVVREWRGKGLSSAVISAALEAYRNAGFVNALLDVDSANPSGALGMYERLGFQARDRSVTLAKWV